MNQYFKRKEFACHCGCGFDSIDAETMEVLVDVREHFDSPVVVNSGSRCSSHNKEIGGKVTSQHLISRAADIHVKGIAQYEVADYLETKYPDRYGIGRYMDFTHIDTRRNKARW